MNMYVFKCEDRRRGPLRDDFGAMALPIGKQISEIFHYRRAGRGMRYHGVWRGRRRRQNQAVEASVPDN